MFGCHTETLVNVNSGIEKPEDLRGKRVGVPEYPVTAIMYIRQAFEMLHGVKPEEITWYEERADWCSHYRLMGYRPPAGVPVQVIYEVSPLQMDATTASKLLGELFRYVCGLTGDSPLTFRYYEVTTSR